ncbi:efflux transporter outer membrane subunit [Brevundimonas sp.]|uniref:efflux transporter outer membrane subunit n=1 Tax=Brevundimonas sp. TaxID=1871086 RepID=UPI0037C001B9
MNTTHRSAGARPRAAYRLPATATRTLIAVLIAPALAVAGCAPALVPFQPDTRLPAAYEAAIIVPAQTAVLDQWWRLFGDPQLDGLVEGALGASTDARLALARLKEARAIRGGAMARYRLQGDLQGNAAAERLDLLDGDVGSGSNAAVGDTRLATAAFNLSWEADLFGRASSTRRAADADLTAARFLYEGSRAALAADVAEALFSARGLAVQLADAERSLAVEAELLDVLRIRAERGLTARSDASRAEANLRQTQARAAQLAGDLQAAKRALLVLTGAPRTATIDLAIDPSLPEAPPPPRSMPGDLLERRPDIREAEARFRSATARSELQRLELFPRFTLEPGVGLTAATGVADYAIGTWTLGASVFLPILDRPRLLSELGAQTALAEQAAVAYERTVQVAFSEADQALVRLQADRSRVALLTQAEARAAEACAAARERFARGLGDLTTTLDAERSWRATRLELSVARIDALQRTVTVFRALGGGWSPSRIDKDQV